MGKRISLSLLVLAVFLYGNISAQPYPPRRGQDYPPGYYERLRADKNAFQFQKAWIQKAGRAKANRARILREFYRAKARSAGNPLMTPPSSSELRELLQSRPMETIVSGTYDVPVFMVSFANTPASPYPSGDLQTELFDGPWATGTMSEFYSEISYGNLSLTGTVYDWFALSQDDTYYEGTENGLGSDSKVGQLILETLNNWDASIDFGQYDNDGPDGVPNSGDDDGYVDFVSFVHPEIGGECGNTNIWSHRWVVAGWPEFSGPYVTNDSRAGGGSIMIYDYTIQPALSCSGSMIEIGVYCHEFGHAFGLPDLYDTDGGSAGIGHWGLMGSGSWNEPESPSHMCAWSKMELGWIIPVDVGPVADSYSIDNVEFNAEAYRLNIMEEKWRRLTDCSISGDWSMHCGLTAAEAAARNWPGGEGYGNSWDVSVQRDFTYNGSGSVFLTFDYVVDSENGYDETELSILVSGTEYQIRTYDGVGAGSANLDLTAYLSGGTGGSKPYTLRFRFTSDSGWADSDDSYNSTCGAFTFDNVTVTGGGESYSTGFEEYEDGWYVDMSDPGEFFLVENRQDTGFDQYVHGPGLAIWHIDQNVGGNTGGSSNNQPRKVQLEEADGLDNLKDNDNRGDAGDIYPGTSMNTSLGSGTVPSSYSNNGNPTNVEISAISESGDPMTATMKAGWFPPAIVSVVPDSGYVDAGLVAIEVLGTGFNKGAVFSISSGGPPFAASSTEWIGHAKLSGTLELTGLPSGKYDLTVENPDGQTTVLVEGFTVIDTTTTDADDPGTPMAFALSQNVPNPFNPSTSIYFDLPERLMVTLRIYDVNGRVVRTLVDGVLAADHHEVRWDGRNDGGASVASGVYFYRIQAGGKFTDVRKMVLMR